MLPSINDRMKQILVTTHVPQLSQKTENSNDKKTSVYKSAELNGRLATQTAQTKQPLMQLGSSLSSVRLTPTEFTDNMKVSNFIAVQTQYK